MQRLVGVLLKLGSREFKGEVANFSAKLFIFCPPQNAESQNCCLNSYCVSAAGFCDLCLHTGPSDVICLQVWKVLTNFLGQRLRVAGWSVGLGFGSTHSTAVVANTRQSDKNRKTTEHGV